MKVESKDFNYCVNETGSDPFALFVNKSSAEIVEILGKRPTYHHRIALAQHESLFAWPDIAHILATDTILLIRKAVAANPSIILRPDLAIGLANDTNMLIPFTLYCNANFKKLKKLLTKDAIDKLNRAAAISYSNDKSAMTRQAFVKRKGTVWFLDIAEKLACDPNKWVRYYMMRNEAIVQFPSVVEMLSEEIDFDEETQASFARNAAIASWPDILEKIVMNQNWNVRKYINRNNYSLSSLSLDYRRDLAIRAYQINPDQSRHLAKEIGIPITIAEAQKHPAIAGEMGILSEEDWFALLTVPGFVPVLALKNPHLPESIRDILSLGTT